jgi:ATP-dependent Lon protease
MPPGAFNAAMTSAIPALPTEQLRWRCAPDRFDFETTESVDPVLGIIGQQNAVDALSFGLEISAPGQNIFVRGLSGTGRATLIRGLLQSIRPKCSRAPDRCYVFNFDKPDRPRLLTLPRGHGRRFRDAMEQLIRFIGKDLAPALSGDAIKTRGKTIEKQTAKSVAALTEPFEAELQAAGLGMVMAQVGPVTRHVILPSIDGEPAPPERLDALKQEGKITEEEIAALREKAEAFTDRMQEIGSEIQKIQARSQEQLRTLIETEARSILSGMEADILDAAGGGLDVKEYLDAVVEDVISEGLAQLGEPDEFTGRYRINLLQSHEKDQPCPIIEESAPSVQTLLGTIDRSVIEEDISQGPHMLIHSGSLLRADGGYLVLEAREVLSEPGAWRALIRTLRSRELEMVAPDGTVTWRVPPIKPDPIPVNVKVVLLGDASVYYALDALDADFPELFKVLADFDDVVPRDAQSLQFYAGVLSRFARDEELAPFHRSAVAALCEHGARIAARPDKLTARFGRLADIAREAAYLADKADAPNVLASHVQEAVRRTKRRADLPSRRFQEQVARGAIKIATHGETQGQINGLAVIQAGPLTYGFPSRITCAVGPGREGAINVEDEAQMSGRIHTKGFHILGGLLRNLVRTDFPLMLNASIAFEQSYGGIDGDSASGAEFVCLMSALAELPARQDLAMTGAIDQHGNIEPIGAANEKIEGFYDVCQAVGFTGKQGVVIPQSNVGDLMLRQDVVDACDAGRFRVYGVSRIEEALTLFLGTPPGERDAEGNYPPDSIFGRARERAWRYFQAIRSQLHS